MAGKTDTSGLCKLMAYGSVTERGLGRTLKFEDDAMLELGRFDSMRSSMLIGDVALASVDAEKPAAAETPAGEPAPRKKHFTNFRFRKRNHDRNVAGPVLAVVDADVNPADR